MKSRYIEEKELREIKQSIPLRLWLPLWVSLETGLRVGDVVALTRRSLQADGIHYRAQKTGKKGIAPISAELHRELSRSKGKYLFPSPKKPGQHLTRQAVWARIKSAGKRAGLDLEGLSPHAMRKCFAVELYRERGFKAVKTALQHNNSATTEIYSFADWNTGKNADLPLKRKDLQLIVQMCLEALGGSFGVEKKECEK